jgi:hypothetical protein
VDEGGGELELLERRFAAIEARLRVVEDELEILRLLSSYGPLVDSGSAAAAADLWVAGGGYDFGDGTDSRRVVAPDGLVALYESQVHRDLVEAGASHLTATPRVAVRGDVAEAVGYSFVIARDAEGWQVRRAAINHWILRRSPAGWRVQQRVNRLLDGSPESQEVMRRALG